MTSGTPVRGTLLPAEHEQALRRRLWARDEQALAELIALTSPWLLGVAVSVLKDAEQAEEVVYDVYRTAWDRVTPPDAESTTLVPWLLRITRNRAIDRLRARRRRPDAVGGRTRVALDAALELADDATAPTDPWVHRRVKGALALLPPPQREAVTLAYFDGLTHSEIAERTGAPLGTVKTRVRLAMARLREVLAPLDGVAR
jgi:RNA polymerase sigma-70 factor (ECF subfamily)